MSWCPFDASDYIIPSQVSLRPIPNRKHKPLYPKPSGNKGWSFHAVTENQISEMDFGFMREVAYLTDLTTPEAPESIQKTYKH